MNPSPAAVEIAVFARAPVPGQAKTRLAPRLGFDAAARLQSWLTWRALERATAVPGARVCLWTAGEPGHPLWQELAAALNIEVRSQVGGALGARMAHAFSTTLADKSGPMLLIGTDCPAQTPLDLIDAIESLKRADAVIQPALDGGYVLIGLNRPCSELFDGIAWSTASVAGSTRRRARSARLDLAEIKPLPDLDLPADLDAALAAGWVPPQAWA